MSAVVIVGLSGAGKSSVAEILEKQYQKKVFDTDAEVVRAAGKSIEEIIRVEGEDSFRKKESEAIDKAKSASCDYIVIGAGALEAEENYQNLRNHKFLWLKVGIQEALKRIEACEERRPLLELPTYQERLYKLQQMEQKRDARYRNAAATVHSDWVPAIRVAETVLNLKMDGRSVYPFRFQGMSSDTHVGKGIRSDFLGSELKRHFNKATRVALVTDSNVAKHWLPELRTELGKSEIQVHDFIIPAGETSKNLKVVEEICIGMAENAMTRADIVVALGGGVVGDIAGLVASLYMRGIGFVQIPTSLVAQVDSAIGGKTGVDLVSGKNLVGTFYPARLIVIDTELLSTLPDREFRSGMAEVIKYGVIASASFLSWLEEASGEVLSKKPEALLELVQKSVRIKLEAVAEDPLDLTGKRASLNFGHTFGHALEKLLNYQHLLHGEAIAIGMVFAAKLGVKLNESPRLLVGTLERVLSKYGLDSHIPTELLEKVAGNDLNDAWRKALRSDKKRLSEELSYVLIPKAGSSSLKDVSFEAVLEEIAEQREKSSFATG